MRLRWVDRYVPAPEYGPGIVRQVRVLQVGELRDPVTGYVTLDPDWHWTDVPIETEATGAPDGNGNDASA